MKLSFRIMSIAFIILVVLLLIPPNHSINIEPTKNIRIGTLNISASRVYTDVQPREGGPHQWGPPNYRRDSISSELLRVQLDVIALQEVKPDQLSDLEESLGSQYRSIPGCMIRKNQSDSGFSNLRQPILARSARFSVEGSGCFMLSSTPHLIGSKSWGTGERMVSWAILNDRATGSQVTVANVHFPGARDQEYARRKSAELVGDFLRRSDVQKTRHIVLGDFNSQPTSATHKILQDQYNLVDSSRSEREMLESTRTYNSWGNPFVKSHVDYIFSNTLLTFSYEVHETDNQGNLLSDHNLVVAELQYPPSITD